MNEVYPVTNYTNTPTPTNAIFKINNQFDKAPLPEIPRYDGNKDWCIKTTEQLTTNIIKLEELGDKYNSYLEICPKYGPVFTPSPFTTSTPGTNTSTPFTTSTVKTNTSTPFTTSTSRTNTSTPFTTTSMTNTPGPLMRTIIQNDPFSTLIPVHNGNATRYTNFSISMNNPNFNIIKTNIRSEAQQMRNILVTYITFTTNKNEYANLKQTMTAEQQSVNSTLALINNTNQSKFQSDNIQTRMNTHFNNIQNFSAQLN